MELAVALTQRWALVSVTPALVFRVNAAEQLTSKRRTVTHATCALDPHTAETCKVSLDDNGARVLRDALTEWLG